MPISPDSSTDDYYDDEWSCVGSNTGCLAGTSSSRVAPAQHYSYPTLRLEQTRSQKLWYYPSGRLALQCGWNYRTNQRDGYSIWFDEDGEIIAEVLFVAGQKVRIQ